MCGFWWFWLCHVCDFPSKFLEGMSFWATCITPSRVSRTCIHSINLRLRMQMRREITTVTGLSKDDQAKHAGVKPEDRNIPLKGNLIGFKPNYFHRLTTSPSYFTSFSRWHVKFHRRILFLWYRTKKKEKNSCRHVIAFLKISAIKSIGVSTSGPAYYTVEVTHPQTCQVSWWSHRHNLFDCL